MNLNELRRDYTRAALDVDDVDRQPMRQFARWFEEARASGLREPNAMLLATADADGRPSARVVLMKDFDDEGLVFFTNYESRKGHDLLANPQAAVTFFWVELERQIRIEGQVERVSAAESDAYFATRSAQSRLGAWASAQSRVIAGRAELEAQLATFSEKFADGAIPRPVYWGGYRLRPNWCEFWQGRSSRLHDRLVYCRVDHGWQIERLAP